MFTKYPSHRNIQWKILKSSIQILLSNVNCTVQRWSCALVSGTCSNQPSNKPLCVQSHSWSRTELQIQDTTRAKSTMCMCNCVMCGIKSCDESAVRRGMMLYSKIHRDIPLQSKEQRFVLWNPLSLCFFFLPFPFSFSTRPSHTGWLWWSWTDSKPTACQSTVKRQFQMSLQQL